MAQKEIQERRAFRFAYLTLAAPALTILIFALPGAVTGLSSGEDWSDVGGGFALLAWILSPYVVLALILYAIERWLQGRLAGRSAVVSALLLLAWTVAVFAKAILWPPAELAQTSPEWGLIMIFAPFYQLPVALICGTVCVLIAVVARVRATPRTTPA